MGALLDNYESDTGVPEVVTDQELAENQRFINLVFESKPMQLAYRFLKYKGKATDDVATVRRFFRIRARVCWRNTSGTWQQRSHRLPQLDPVLPSGEGEEGGLQRVYVKHSEPTSSDGAVLVARRSEAEGLHDDWDFTGV